MRRRVGFSREQLRRPHRTWTADAREVVPQQVHDHEVLGPLLGVRAEFGEPGVVVVRVAPARRRALHRPGGGLAVGHIQEQLGREREDPAVAGGDEAAVGHRLAGAQRAVERQRVAGIVEAKREGEVHLVEIAGGDQVQGPANPCGMRLAARAAPEAADRRRRRARRKRPVQVSGADLVAPPEDPEPHQGLVARGRGEFGEPGFERAPALIGQPAGDVLAGRRRPLDRSQAGLHLREGAAGVDRPHVAVEASAAARAHAILEQDERRVGEHGRSLSRSRRTPPPAVAPSAAVGQDLIGAAASSRDVRGAAGERREVGAARGDAAQHPNTVAFWVA